MTITTIGELKRLPDQIAGDNRWDINITGGHIANVTLDYVTLTGTTFLTPISILAGGTGASDAVTGLSNLGGQPVNANLTTYATKTPPTGAVVGTTDTQTLTGKTISGANNTVTALPNTALNNSSVTLGTTNVALGATATAINGLTVNKVNLTAPATSATLALADGSTLATSGAFNTTLTATAATNVTLPTTGILATRAGTEALTNKTVNGVNLSSTGSVQSYLNQAGGYVTTGTLIVRDEKPSGTNGGNTAASSTVTRTLNTVSINTIAGASLATSQIILPAGGYIVTGRVPCYGSDLHKCYLRNITASNAVAISGSGSFSSSSGAYGANDVFLNGYVSIASTMTFDVLHYTQSAKTNGQGLSIGSGSAEVYTEIIIQKVA